MSWTRLSEVEELSLRSIAADPDWTAGRSPEPVSPAQLRAGLRMALAEISRMRAVIERLENERTAK